MAIAFDSSGTGVAETGTAITFAHVCSGVNRILTVGVGVNGTTDVITGVTYAGTAMTQATKQQLGAGAMSYLYFYVNPATGTNNVVVSSSADAYLRAISSSYTGAKQTGQFDGTVSGSVANGTIINTTITTVNDQCWNVSFAVGDQTTPFAASSGVNSVRGTHIARALGDSNSYKSPAGAYGMTWTSGTQNIGAIQVSIIPNEIDAANTLDLTSKSW